MLAHSLPPSSFDSKESTTKQGLNAASPCAWWSILDVICLGGRMKSSLAHRARQWQRRSFRGEQPCRLRLIPL